MEGDLGIALHLPERRSEISKSTTGLPVVSNPLSNSSTAGGMCAAFGVVRRIRQYIAERFPLAQFLPLSAVVSLPAALGTQAYIHSSPYSIPAALLTFGAVFLLLLRLRLVDELKDLEHDRRFYPNRPLPRGLVQPREVGWVAAGVVLIEVLLATAAGVSSLALFALVGLYSVATSCEFFCREWLRSHFTVYVVSHELLIVPVCFYLYSLSGLTIGDLAAPYFWGLTAYIGCLLVLLEVARKLSPSRGETDANDTYTSRYGAGVSSLVVGFLAIGTATTGILIPTMLRGDIVVLPLVGVAFVVPVGISLIALVKRPGERTAKAVLNRCALLAVASSSLFVLTAWFS